MPPNPPSATSSPVLTNSNGKRPHNALSSTTSLTDAMATNAADADFDFGATSSPEGNMATHQQVHKQSGYTWTREADEPGFTWKNKKATDEMQRTWDGLAHRDLMVKGRYGDPVEVAAKEREMMTGMK